MVGEWVGLGCEKIGRGYLRRRVPLVLTVYGLEETKWTKIGGRCSMLPVQCSPKGCCVGCTVKMGRDLGEACSSMVLDLRKHFSVCIYACIITVLG